MTRMIAQLACCMTMLGLTSSLVHAQEQLYSYVDRQTGERVFTNIQPTAREAPELAAQLAAQERQTKAATSRLRSEPSLSAAVIDPNQYKGIIERYADRHQVDPKLIQAVIRAESNFNPRAVSPKGAKGLMQLMPGTAQRYGVRNIFDPEENIQGGIRYLRFLLDMFNEDLRHTLAAYNAGEHAVLRVGGIPPYRETIEYVKRVTRFYGHEKHKSPGEPPNPFGVYVYRDKDGSLMLTNVEPPRAGR